MGAIDEPLPIRRHRLTVEEYHKLGEAGILAPDARVELIEGEVIDLAPIGSRHWATVVQLDRLLRQAVGDTALVVAQSSMRLGSRSEPQPDIALFYARHGVRELWVLDLDERVFHRFLQPGPQGYASATSSREPAVQAIDALPGVTVDLTGLLA